jgi:hypothetical protein
MPSPFLHNNGHVLPCSMRHLSMQRGSCISLAALWHSNMQFTISQSDIASQESLIRDPRKRVCALGLCSKRLSISESPNIRTCGRQAAQRCREHTTPAIVIMAPAGTSDQPDFRPVIPPICRAVQPSIRRVQHDSGIDTRQNSIDKGGTLFASQCMS